MFPFSFLSNLTADPAYSMLAISLVIILCAFLIEDVATIVVGVLAADGIVPIPLAFFSLYLGIIIGDLGLYALGALARTHPRLDRYIDHGAVAPFRSWLGTRYPLTIFFGHFVPGLRFTTYVASGFFRHRFLTFIPAAMAGGLVLVTIYFTASYWFGSITAKWAVHARWGIAILFILILFFIGRHNLLKYRAKKNLDSADIPYTGTHEN